MHEKDYGAVSFLLSSNRQIVPFDDAKNFEGTAPASDGVLFSQSPRKSSGKRKNRSLYYTKAVLMHFESVWN
jgi:hypothetical protein